MRACIYTRQSLDRDGDELAVTRQREDCARLCAERGWAVAETVCDNDVSASNGRPRPGFRRVLTLIDQRHVDVVVVWHVDRLVRRLADLEDVIDRCERSGVRLATVSGDLDLSTDAGRLVGRILAAVARGEVERKGARQRRALLQAAEAGKPAVWSHRPFGYRDDKVTLEPVEAEAVRDGCAVLLAGGSVRGVARAWTAAGIAPPRGAEHWHPQTVRAVMSNPRIAALRTYKGDVVGQGQWPPLVPEATWRAVAALLDDPGRVTPRGVRTLLGGLASCPCGAPAYGGRNHRGARIYRCREAVAGRAASAGGSHVARAAEPVDAYVIEVVVERLGRDDAADLLVDDSRPDVGALRAEAAAVRARLDRLAEMHTEGDITDAQLRAGTRRARTRLAELEADIGDAEKVSILAPLIAAADVAAVWRDLDLDRQRAVIDTLMEVTLRPPGRGARVFDPHTVICDWRGRGG